MTMPFHLIGVGGAGMSVVAELLLAAGHQVTGSDSKESETLSRLGELGVKVSSHQDRGNVPPDAVVVYSSAIRPDNPELQVAKERGQRILHRSEALAYASADRLFVAVAGAHGKTTTSAMIARSLSAIGADPSWAVGSSILGLGSGAHLGQGDVFVAEADESDGSFLNYSPTVAVVTNIEADHLDHYGSQECFAQAFVDFARRLRPHGDIPATLVACSDDAGVRKLITNVAQNHNEIRLITYGQDPCDLSDRFAAGGHIGITDTSITADGSTTTLTIFDQTSVELTLQVAGFHNVLDAAAAVGTAAAVGISPAKMAAALSGFAGTGRRFELRANVGGRRLFDDYAHHPTEVAAALEQARVVAGGGEVHVLFQPHLFSRTKNFSAQFAAALELADHVALMDIYGAREEPIAGITSALIAQQSKRDFVFLDGMDEESAGLAAARSVKPGDILVLVGAGSVTQAGSAIAEFWALQESQG